jgi:hypothetical protein
LEGFIMKRQIVSSLLLALGLAFAGGAVAADAASTGGVVASENADGSVVLSNVPLSDTAEATAPDTAAAPAAEPQNAAQPSATAQTQPAAEAPAAAETQTAAAEPARNPREQYRDQMLQGTPGTTAENPSISRRYKMMDRATYQTTVLGAGAQTTGSSK